MGKRRTLEEKFLRKPPDVSFSEVNTLMRRHGAQRVGGDGSHNVYRRPDGRKITVPKKGGQRVSRVYIVQIIEFLGIEDKK